MQAKELPFEQQKQVVQQNLHNQLVNIGRTINSCLVQVRMGNSEQARKYGSEAVRGSCQLCVAAAGVGKKAG